MRACHTHRRSRDPGEHLPEGTASLRLFVQAGLRRLPCFSRHPRKTVESAGIQDSAPSLLPAFLCQRVPKVIVSNVVILSDSYALCEQALAVAPKLNLASGDGNATRDNQEHSEAGDGFKGSIYLQYFPAAPGKDQEETDEGQISVPVGHGLVAHLDKSDYRDQGPQMPQGPLVRRQVQDGKLRRPNHFLDVG